MTYQKRRLLHSFAIALALLAVSAFAQGAFAAVNVQDCGARGDGSTDDTAAIQAAMDQAQKSYRGEPYPGGVYHVTSPEVFFPSGKYVISDTVQLAGTVIRGEGYAVIEQRNPDRDIFSSDWAWRMTIEGLTFVGGRSHISLGNPNLDIGMLTIRDCRFYGSAGPACEFRKGTNSTLAIIRDCVFLCCAQALITYTDQTALRDCWITSRSDMKNAAVIEARGVRLIVDNLLGVPLVNGQDQRWIDNYGGTLTCLNCRFGGEGGGFTPVVNFTGFTSQAHGSTILLDDCLVAALGNNMRACAVYCEEIPNAIELRGCTLIGVPAIAVDKRIDLKTYFRGARPGMLAFTLGGNLGELASVLPDGLRKPVIPKAAPSRETASLSAAKTRTLLERARKYQSSRKREPASPGEFDGHRQQTDPAKYIAITPASHRWDLDDVMDATSAKNSEYLALTPLGQGAVIMRRRPARGTWPHVLIRDVTVDLDRFPWLTWRQRDSGTGTPACHAVKALDKATGKLLLLQENGYGGNGSAWYGYYAYNLKDLFGLSGGKRTFDVKFYYLGIGPPKTSDPVDFVYASPGDYIVLDYVRLEQ